MRSTQIYSPDSINSLSELKKRILKKDRLGRNRSRSCRCSSFHQHDSAGEAEYCDILKALKNTKQIKDYNIQVTYDLIVKGEVICRHRVDFLVKPYGKPAEVHEYKGFRTEIWNIKYKLFKACYPKIPYIIIDDRKPVYYKWPAFKKRGKEIWKFLT